MSVPMMLEWLPLPKNFAADLKATLAIDDASKRLAGLETLAQHRLSYLETLQLDRALNAQKIDAASGYTSLRLALLGTSTMDHLAPCVRVAGVRRRLRIEAYVGAYGQYRQELLDAHRGGERLLALDVELLETAPPERQRGPVLDTNGDQGERKTGTEA